MTVEYSVMTTATAGHDEHTFQHRLNQRETLVAVVGLGYTGLPVAHGLAAGGYRVRGLDIDPEKLALLRQGRSYLPDLSNDQIREVGDLLSVSDDPATVSEAEVVMVCVPTPLTPDDQADLSALDAALAALAPGLRPGTVVIMQSTVPPGTTSERARRLAAATSLKLGESLFVAFAPERVNPANRDGWTVQNTPRVVGGQTPECTRRAVAALSTVCRHLVPVSSPTVAELAKLLENTARLVNISLANEFSDMCFELGVPVHEVIDAAATKPFGFLAHRPGPGIGGECIPVDPVFLLADAGRARPPMPVLAAAHRQAVQRPGRVVTRALDLLAAAGRPGRILVLGAAYKPNVPDVRNTPAVPVLAELHRHGVEADYHDPFVPRLRVDGRTLRSVPEAELRLSAYDLVVLLTPHDAFAGLAWADAPLVLDTVNWLTGLPTAERM